MQCFQTKKWTSAPNWDQQMVKFQKLLTQEVVHVHNIMWNNNFNKCEKPKKLPRKQFGLFYSSVHTWYICE